MQDAAAGYFGLINHVDDRVRFVLTRLFEYGSPRAAEPTVILFTSDHGELLGDHHLWRKSLAYEGSAHIPFFIGWRNMDGLVPGSCDALVGLEDVCATVLDLCGLPQPEAFENNLNGQSLAPALRGDACTPREVLFGECRHPANHYVVHGDAKYIWFPKTGEEQLFNLRNDPQELSDLSGDEALLSPFRDLLDRHLADRDDYAYNRDALIPCKNRPPKVFWG
jgi:arylsulfatase A-like enzyme